MRLLLKNATVFCHSGWQTCDVFIDGPRIASIHETPTGQYDVLEASHHYLVPGLADVHVHLREPGFSLKETIRTGTRAAARGGYTLVATMPNLSPAPDGLETLQQQLRIIEQDAVTDVVPYGTITVGQQGKALADMTAMAPYVLGFSDDGVGVASDALMERAMQTAKALLRPIVDHCEDVRYIKEGAYIHDGAYAKAHGHLGISSESEWRQVQRDADLCEKTGCHVHICHVSTKESVEIIRRAKERGLPITCETAPHYLLLCEEDLQEDGRFKMNPPLRMKEDRQALVAALCDGTIDVIATDHAPHTKEEKSRGLSGSNMGIVGLETAFAVLYTKLVKEGVLSLHTLVERMAVAPRRIFGIPGGVIEEGARAELALFEVETPYAIDSNAFLSMGRATPFDGWQVQGKNVLTILDDHIIYREGGR